MKISYKTARNFCVTMSAMAVFCLIILMSIIDNSSSMISGSVFGMMIFFLIGTRAIYLFDVQPKSRQRKLYTFVNC
jgi:putative effector of murein hydrolase LrgA (UPF0299 family)